MRLEKIMTDSYAAVRNLAAEHGTDLRTAAYMISIQRIAEGMKARGWV
jgi:glutamate dehydrogenase